MTESHPQGVLEPGYRLLWYRIGRILGRGAFGTTYLAEDINLQRPVAIKEFFPNQYCSRQPNSTHVRPLSDDSQEDFRWAMERFLSEARTLAQFEHPNIIRVINVFEENGTAYMVMHYESGISLSALLKKRRTLNEKELARIAIPILDGLEKVHTSGFIHRDIKPSNIYLREGGSPVLLDFGSARQSMQEYTQTLTSLVSPGYAPIEQYTSKGERQGPWTDIYGMGATLYRAVTGLVPPSAVDRSEALSEGKEDYMTRAAELVRAPYSDLLLNAIDHALAFSIDQRPQNIADWRTEFGFNMADIDTQPDYNTDYGSDGGTSKQHMTEQQQQSDNDIINIAGSEGNDASESSTAVNTAPTEQAAAENADASESETEQLSQPVDRSHRSRFTYPTVGAAAAAVLVIAVMIAMGRSTSTPAPESVDNEAAPTVITPADSAATESEQIQRLLQAARQDIDAMRLTTPADNNAHDKIRQVLERDPDNAEAQRGLEAIYNRYMQMAQRAAQDDQFDKAGELLDRAAMAKPDAPGIMRARVQLEQQRTEVRMQSLSDTLHESESDETDPAVPEEEDSTGGNKALQRMLGRDSP